MYCLILRNKHDNNNTRKTFFATLEYFLNNFQGKIGLIVIDFTVL